MWVQVTDTTDVCLIIVSSQKTVKNSNKICKWANNIINKTLLKDFLWHLLIAVKNRGGVWTTGYACILRFTVLPEILFAYKHINHCFSVSRISSYSPWIINKLLWVFLMTPLQFLCILSYPNHHAANKIWASFYKLIKIITHISFSCFTVSSVIGGIIVSTSPQSWSDDLTLSLILIIKLFLTICKNLYFFLGVENCKKLNVQIIFAVKLSSVFLFTLINGCKYTFFSLDLVVSQRNYCE